MTATFPAGLKPRLAGRPADRLLLALTLACIMLIWQMVHARLAGGEPMVAVYHGQTLLARYPLHVQHPIRFEVLGDLGPADIEIDPRGVRFTDSPCHGKNCIRAGHRHRIGDVIACVPNRILVAIVGTQRAFDAVAE